MCLKSLQGDKLGLASEPSPLDADPETAGQPVACAGTHSEAVKKGVLGFCTGI